MNSRCKLSVLILGCLSTQVGAQFATRGELRGPKDLVSVCIRRLESIIDNRHMLGLMSRARFCADQITEALDQQDKDAARRIAEQCIESITATADILKTWAERIVDRCARMLRVIDAPPKLFDILESAHQRIINNIQELRDTAIKIIHEALNGSAGVGNGP